MKRHLSIMVGALLIGLGIYLGWINATAQRIKPDLLNLMTEIKAAGLDQTAWNELNFPSQAKIPRIFPFSLIHSGIDDTADLVTALTDVQTKLATGFQSQRFDTPGIFMAVDRLSHVIGNIDQKVSLIPEKFLDQETAGQVAMGKAFLQKIRGFLGQINPLKKLVGELHAKERRVILILQNQNEPRATGGFMGSFVILDFKSDQTIAWKFEDMYAIDRKISAENQFPAPDYFAGLTENISLRDANISPDFPTSARLIQDFFVAGGERKPDILIATNLRLVATVLQITGPVFLPKWDIELTAENFESRLQFLVESKVAGKYAVKTPVLEFAQALFSPTQWQKISAEKLSSIDWLAWWEQKNITAYSELSDWNDLFQKLDIAGQINQETDSDNFLHAEFISVGANKSEKYMWTKFTHDSLISSDGTVTNKLKIKRTHGLRPGEIDDALGFASLSQNLQDLVTEKLRWILGAGENRTVLRIWFPAETGIVRAISPSGKIENISAEIPESGQKFMTITFPMNVLPGESATAEVVYTTKINRGSRNWRPYNFQIVGTPGRAQTTFLSRISLAGNGKFSAESFNLGRPVPLIDQNFRSVIEF